MVGKIIQISKDCITIKIKKVWTQGERKEFATGMGLPGWFLLSLPSVAIPNLLELRQCVSVCVCLVAQSYLTLCDPMDCSPRGSSVHGILQARIPEWVAISFSRIMAEAGLKPRQQSFSFITLLQMLFTFCSCETLTKAHHSLGSSF